MSQEEILLTRYEAAERLRISLKTLDRWREHSVLVPIVIGGVIRYRREDIDALINRVAS